MLYDISRPLAPDMAPWPGDTAYHFALAWKRSAGATVNVGAVTISVHFGTHADAPFHFTDDGAGAGEMALDAFIGAAQVVDCRGAGATIGPEWFADLDGDAPRLLLRTDAWTDSTHFPASIPTLAPGVAASLSARGIVLIGVDVPSVDTIDSHDLPNHHALHAGGIRILEGLDLRGVAAGRYELIALPLALSGADGSPVRAILRDVTA